jgi:hypothetical protein
LAAVLNILAAALITALAIVHLAINYSAAPPSLHGCTHLGIFTGLWYLGVVILMIRLLLKGKLGE